MLTAVLVAAVVGGGVLVLLRRLFPQQKALPPLRLPGDTMRGKTVIITGANSGIGKALAGELLALQARVIMACRDRDRAEEAAREIRAQTGARGELEVRILDLASLQSVRRFCEQINQEEPRLDVLVNNAGVYQCPYSRTEDGFETQFGVNHLGHFLLTHLLLDLLRRSSPSRVVVVSSKLYKYGFVNFQDLNSETSYDKAFCYSQSKLANLLFTLELATRLRRREEEEEESRRSTGGEGGAAAVQEEVPRVTVNALTPGIVRTNLGRHVPIPLLAKPLFKMASMAFFKTPLQGAQTPLYLATSPEVDGVSGKCFANCKEEELTAAATDREAARRLWEVSCKMVGIEE